MDDSEFASKLQELIDMGFSDSSALEALSKCNDMESAVNYLFNISSTMLDPSKILYNSSMPSEPKILPPMTQPNHKIPFNPPSFPIPQKVNMISPLPPFTNSNQNFYNPGNHNQYIPNPLPQGNYQTINNFGTSNLSKIGGNPGIPGPALYNHGGPPQITNFTPLSTHPPPLPPFHGKNQDIEEDYIEFLSRILKDRGNQDELISEIVSNCSSKEEALLILGIPISFKDSKLSQIPEGLLNAANKNEQEKTQIINELIKEGASQEEAELISITCSNLFEAYQVFYENCDNMSFNGRNNIPKVPFPMPNKNQSKYPKKAPEFMIPPPVKMVPKLNPNYPPQPLFPAPHLSPINLFDQDLFYSPYSKHHKSSAPIVLNNPSESDPVAPDLKTEYFESLKGFRLIMSENQAAFNNFVHGNIVSGTPQSLKRINNEIKTLQNSVPCDSTASIFVMIDSECMHRIKFLLSGTIDTPYAHGLYLFDVLLPPNYPQAPPKVSIMTTGNGRMRFNPNLYSNGYVCLSIINTWSGRPEEQWNPSSSTLLQVMLSIQSLVMDNDILQKEPSFHNLPRNSPENLGYQQEVMYGNIKFAMIDMIRNPPIGMEEIVRNHFKIKKTEIQNTIKLWIENLRKNSKSFLNGSQNQLINSEIYRNNPINTFTEASNELDSLLKTF